MIRVAFALAVTITMLAACGLKGDLDRPVPLLGNPPNEGANDPRTLRAKEQAEAKRKADEEAARRAARDAVTSQPATPTPMPDRPL
jgi:predicted small lipoprotein YifL